MTEIETLITYFLLPKSSQDAVRNMIEVIINDNFYTEEDQKRAKTTLFDLLKLGNKN